MRSAARVTSTDGASSRAKKSNSDAFSARPSRHSVPSDGSFLPRSIWLSADAVTPTVVARSASVSAWESRSSRR